MSLKLKGLETGKYGFKKNPKKARKIFNEAIGESKEFGKLEKARVLAKGKYGFKKNPKKARSIINELIQSGDHNAYLHKTRGLKKGKYGFKKDPEKAAEVKKELKLKFPDFLFWSGMPVTFEHVVLHADDLSAELLGLINHGRADNIAKATEILDTQSDKVGSATSLMHGFTALGEEPNAEHLRGLIASKILKLNPKGEVIEQTFNNLLSGQIPTATNPRVTAYRFASMLNFIPTELR